MNTRKRFTPVPGHIYRNQGGGQYLCLECLMYSGEAVMQNTASGWTLQAHGCGIYPDGTIDWDYSTQGHWEKRRGPNETHQP